MSLWKIAWRSVQKRGVASLLTTFTMALGVMLVVSVLSVHGVVSEQFKNSSNLGYNMLIGAKGGKLQLTLNSVFYLSEPVENIDYRYYLEFYNREERDRQLKQSFAFQAHEAAWDTIALSQATGLNGGGITSLAEQSTLEAAASILQRTDLQLGRDGQFAQFSEFAIPVCLGDYFGRFRVVGTTPEFFERLVTDPVVGSRYAFAEGRNLEVWTPEHQYFEAVVGSKVAREMDVSLGDVINPAHGDPEGHGHAQGFTVVGILEPSGKPNDRAVFINMEGFFLMADHAKPMERPDDAPIEMTREEIEAARANKSEPLPVEQREVTAVLVRTISPFVAPGMENLINEAKEAQAVLPVKEIYDLMDLIVRPIQQLLLGITALICLVSGVSILVSIYNSMSDRRHEIAVMRALGASRNVVMTIILLEAVFLALGGGLFGWFMGHSLNFVLAPTIEDRTGVQLTFLSLAPEVNPFEPLGIVSDRVGLKVPVLCLFAWVVGLALAGYAGVTIVIRGFRESAQWGWATLLAHPIAAPWFAWTRARTAFFWWAIGIFLILGGAVGYAAGADDAVSSELLLIPALILLAIFVGFFPAVSAYRTDVSQSLGK